MIIKFPELSELINELFYEENYPRCDSKKLLSTPMNKNKDGSMEYEWIIPGCNKNDIEAIANKDNNTLYVKAIDKKGNKQSNYLKPGNDCDVTKSSTRYEDGILYIKIPKSENKQNNKLKLKID